jgi:predicted choloylglycine hydrolase
MTKTLWPTERPADLSALTDRQLSELATQTCDLLASRGRRVELCELAARTGQAIGKAFPVASSATLREFPITMYGIKEARPDARWKALFDATWPGYRKWYETPDGTARPSLREAQAMLARHMPELVQTYERLVDLADGDETAARMLTLWNPPVFAPGCSQMVITAPERMLVRNYDYSPELFEQVSYSSEFNKQVLGTSDCLWGLLDGMNADGLVVSLAYGGEKGSGDGFGIPLVVRYLLEVAATVEQARAVLARIPVNMSYNLTVMDASGSTLTAFVSPNAAPEFSTSPIATNHRGEHPADLVHARKFRSVERRETLASLAPTGSSASAIACEFLQPPLRSTNFSAGFGTVYTVVYRPDAGVAEYHWPDQVWPRRFDDDDATVVVTLRGD